MREALEVINDLQAKYIDLSEYKRVSCVEITKASVKDSSEDVGLDDSSNVYDFQIKKLSSKDIEDMDSKELKRYKLNKKKRKLMNSFLFADNLKQWEENIKHKDYCEIKPGS